MKSSPEMTVATYCRYTPNGGNGGVLDRTEKGPESMSQDSGPLGGVVFVVNEPHIPKGMDIQCCCESFA